MRRNYLSISVYIIASILIMAMATFGATINGDVYLIDGSSYLDVKIDIDNTFKIVKIKLDTNTKQVSFHTIASILDNDGNDITRSLIGRDSREIATQQVPTAPSAPQPEIGSDSLGKNRADSSTQKTLKAVPKSESQWESDSDRKIKDYNRKLWSVAIWTHGNLSLPLSDYYDGIDGGTDYGLNFSIAANRQIAIQFSYERAGLKPGKQLLWALTYVSIDPGFEIISQSHTMSASRYQVGAQLIEQSSTPGETIRMAYASTGLGVVAHTIKSSLTLREVSSGYQETATGSYSETKFMTYIGGGIIIGLSPSIGVDVGANLDMLFISSDESYQTQYAYILDLHLGLVFLIK